jgi:hypothetical protein
MYKGKNQIDLPLLPCRQYDCLTRGGCMAQPQEIFVFKAKVAGKHTKWIIIKLALLYNLSSWCHDDSPSLW